jgi:DNA-binding response OmpR family regulator
VASVVVDKRVSRVLLIEPNASLRHAIEDVLGAENYEVVPCDSLDQVLTLVHEHTPEVVLVAWQSMGGLLAEEHRHNLLQLAGRLRLIVMVPRRWMRLLDESEYGLAGMIAKPFEADELLAVLRRALGEAVAAQPAALPAD